MELSHIQEELIFQIYGSDGECLTAQSVLEKDELTREQISSCIDDLIKLELVEFDTHDRAHYLTTEGYEYVEARLATSETISTNEDKSTMARVVYIGALIVLALFVVLTGKTLIHKNEQHLNIPKEVQDEIKAKMDSIKEATELQAQ